jgi:hypothetical protein
MEKEPNERRTRRRYPSKKEAAHDVRGEGRRSRLLQTIASLNNSRSHASFAEKLARSEQNPCRGVRAECPRWRQPRQNYEADKRNGL